MSYRWIRPPELPAALAALADLQEAVLPVAGATNFISHFRAGLVRPEVVMDISRLPLRYIRRQNGWLRIGALSTVADLLRAPAVPQDAPVLYEAARHFAGRLIRNRATVAGNITDASPAADLAPPLLALGAMVTLASAGKERTLPLSEYIVGVRATARRPDELVTEVSVPAIGPVVRTSYFKFGLREAMAVSVVSGAVLLDLDGGKCRQATIALGAVAPVPVRASAVEQALAGQELTPELVREAARRVAVDISPISDVRASAEYRTWVAQAMVRRHVLAAATP